MRRNYFAMVILVTLFSFLGVSNAKGSYASFGTDELIKQSDIILIGDIVGPVDERKDWAQGLTMPGIKALLWNRSDVPYRDKLCDFVNEN